MNRNNIIQETLQAYAIENPELNRADILNLMYINNEISIKQYNTLIA